ncbi:MAG: hypothetical protein HYX51_00305 [Chloroflexi bacterium]|nr:hypothetical protein [Chloroflexota bacterium]
MSRTELIAGLKKLPVAERLAVIEAALHDMREEMQPSLASRLRYTSREEKDRLLQEGARIMADDYANDPELTAFTALDGVAFMESECGEARVS